MAMFIVCGIVQQFYVSVVKLICTLCVTPDVLVIVIFGHALTMPIVFPQSSSKDDPRWTLSHLMINFTFDPTDFPDYNGKQPPSNGRFLSRYIWFPWFL